jgi:beta-galactosidase
MKNNKKQSDSAAISRREFTRRCAFGTAAIAASSILGFDPTRAQAFPQTGPSRFIIPLDQDWLFGGKFNAEAITPQMDEGAFSKVTLPHCVAKLSWQNWDPAAWENVWFYRRHIAWQKESSPRRAFLKFDGVMVGAKPVFNGVALQEHVGGYLPFRYEITQWLKEGDNVLDVAVDSRWQSVPPDGSPKGPRAVDYLEPGGITRSVSLCVLPQIFISDVFAKPVNVLDSTRGVDVTCSINATAAAKPLEVEAKLMDGDRIVSSVQKTAGIEHEGETEVALSLTNLGNIDLWDVDAPRLYDVVVTISMDGEALHDYRTRIGFRDAKFTVEGFFLNGKRRQLFGLDRHEIYPYVGGAMPARVMRRDAEILRHEFNCNIVRCSHYPQTEAFLDACDELGLMVWQEPPGWGYLGDEAWKDLVVQNVEDMIRRDRNHPAIVIWGVRVNESRNDQPLYRRTTEAAKLLDGTRPTSGSMTGGSRKNWREEWHEDVFAFDDYHSASDGSVGIERATEGVPYMLAEAVGQFSYGAKGFNNKYRRAADPAVQVKQALYHAEAHDRAAADKGNSGVIAWCGFEYGSLVNAYKSVKYPGVADVFRIPKLGATFYQAQVSPKTRPVIMANFYWDFGAQTPRGPGKKSVIFSNCGRLDVFVADKQIATLQPDRAGFPHLAYPPFFCDLDIDDASAKPELRIDGYVGDSKVSSKTFSSDASQDQFVMEADDTTLKGDGADAVRVVFRAADKYGQPRALAGGSVAFELTGPGTVVGDNPFGLEESGGAGAIWIKGIPNGTGSIVLKATHSTLGMKSVTVEAS